MNSLTLLASTLATLVALVHAQYPPADKVLLRSISSLYLTKYGYTTHRRIPTPRPQLKCLSGCSADTPSSVTCYNRGGSPLKWDCGGLLPTGYHFEQLNVVCEGYDGPSDAYVLKGSCGLEYSISANGSSNSTVWIWIVVIVAFVIICIIIAGVKMSSRGSGSTTTSGVVRTHRTSPTYIYTSTNYVSSPSYSSGGGGGGGYSYSSGTASTSVI